MSTFQLGQTFKLPLPGRGSGAENQMNAQLFGFPEYVLQYNVCAVKKNHFWIKTDNMTNKSGKLWASGKMTIRSMMWCRRRYIRSSTTILTEWRTTFAKRVCFAVPIFVWCVSVCGCCVGSVWMSGGGGWEVVKIIPVLIRLNRPSSANRGEDRNTAS